ncbi:MAG: sigma-70 family RNA polymerase sigma factor [Actinomycetota bacterium]
MTSTTGTTSLLSATTGHPIPLPPMGGGVRDATLGTQRTSPWPEATRAEVRSDRGGTERETLYLDFQPLVRRLIRQYGEDPELRQDLAGEIYWRFCNLLDAYDPSRGIPLRAYMVRTLTASVYTYSRSQWRRQHREVSLDADNGAVEPAVTIPDPSSQWDRALMTQEVLNTLPAAISQLPLRQRQVVIWRYYESRSFEEIAEMLHIRPATARSLLRHGLNNLRRKVAASPLADD